MEDRRDFEEARRGLVAPFDPPLVEDERGRTVWDLRSYDFLDGEPPETANPSPTMAPSVSPTTSPARCTTSSPWTPHSSLTARPSISCC